MLLFSNFIATIIGTRSARTAVLLLLLLSFLCFVAAILVSMLCRAAATGDGHCHRPVDVVVVVVVAAGPGAPVAMAKKDINLKEGAGRTTS